MHQLWLENKTLQNDRDLYKRSLQSLSVVPSFFKALNTFTEFDDDTISDSNPGEDVTWDENWKNLVPFLKKSYHEESG